MFSNDLLLQKLKKHFGYDGFRAGQEEIIRAILQGENVLAVFMPLVVAFRSFLTLYTVLLFQKSTLMTRRSISSDFCPVPCLKCH